MSENDTPYLTGTWWFDIQLTNAPVALVDLVAVNRPPLVRQSAEMIYVNRDNYLPVLPALAAILSNTLEPVEKS